MKRKISFIIFIIVALNTRAQIDSTLLKNKAEDSISASMNIDAVYNRPFLLGNSNIALGGYLEADYKYLVEDGVHEGHTFSIPRMTIFIAGSMHNRIRFLSELEIEEGGEEISIEFAAMDLSLHPLLTFRGGVIMNPIGAFNQNHDGPKWEFVDRPIAMTQLLPATWSNPGFGIFGKYVRGKNGFSYEYYLTNGFDASIIDNEQGKTFLPASKSGKERFVESSNGHMLQTLKLGSRFGNFEFGISYMGGVYNHPAPDGISVFAKQRVHVLDFDFNYRIRELILIGEMAYIQLDVPVTYTMQYGNRQTGAFLDIIKPFYLRSFWHFSRPILNIACRLEYVDWNLSSLEPLQEPAGESAYSGVFGISFRPVSSSVIRLNYRILSESDILDNPPAKTRGFEFGLATYF